MRHRYWTELFRGRRLGGVGGQQKTGGAGTDPSDHQLSPGRRALPARSRSPPAAPAGTAGIGGPAPKYWLSGAYPSRLWHGTIWKGTRGIAGTQAVDVTMLDRLVVVVRRAAVWPERVASGLARTPYPILGTRSSLGHVTEPRRMGFSRRAWPGMATAADRSAFGPWNLVAAHDFSEGACDAASGASGGWAAIPKSRPLSPAGTEAKRARTSGCAQLRRSLDVRCRPGGPRRFGSRNDRS